MPSMLGGLAARRSGLASGLALAVRPAGLAEVSGVNGAPYTSEMITVGSASGAPGS